MHRWFDQRVDPRHLVDGARSVVIVALNYHQPRPAPTEVSRSAQGRIARYAWGEDYHKVLRRKLAPLAKALILEEQQSSHAPSAPAPAARICVDTSPLMERDFAELAGIGWIGKNTLVLHPELGSFFFLGAIVTTLEIEPDAPMPDHCGTCTRCLDACPTQAFIAPYRMDASRCISYLTIERREPPPPDLQPAMRDWLFGCDVCQEVCPFNRRVPPAREPALHARPEVFSLDAEKVLNWSQEDYDQALRHTAMKRATLSMWKRNARIVRDGILPAEPDSAKVPAPAASRD